MTHHPVTANTMTSDNQPPQRLWGGSLRQHLIDFNRAVINLAPGKWSIVQQTHIETGAIEDALVEAGLESVPADWHEKSVCAAWLKYRKGRAHLGEVTRPVQFCVGRTGPGGGHVCINPHLFDDSELASFRDWFMSVYLPRKLPAYLLGRSKRGGRSDTRTEHQVERDLTRVAGVCLDVVARLTGMDAVIPRWLASRLE